MKNIIFRSIGGFLIGVMIILTFALIASHKLGTGEFYIARPEMIAAFGSELNAGTVSLILGGLLGTMYSLTSYYCFDVMTGNLLKSTLLFYVIMVITQYVAGLVVHAYSFTWPHLLGFIVTFTIAFAIIWLLIFGFLYYKIKKANDKLSKL